MGKTPDLKLGLIGDNIAQSKAPLLHRLAGGQHGMHVTYDRLVPAEIGTDFGAVFDACPGQGYRGLNITYPYKERAAARVEIDDPLVRAMGAVNTVLFEDGRAKGYNTDYTGFVEAYRSVLGARTPGVACLIGTGGVGRAMAFALVALGASEIRLVDKDRGKAEALSADLATLDQGADVRVFEDVSDAADGATGLLNGTPVGMVGYEGTPLPRAMMAGAAWAFDAIYTPLDTRFLKDAEAEGLTVISGYELFIYQGIDAWALFSGLTLDEDRLRAELAERANEV